jgi:hypothetical protein
VRPPGPGCRGRPGRAPRRGAAIALGAALCAGMAATAPLAAQVVGHPPARSPYRDITTHQGFTLFAGRFAGNPGAAGLGARPGLMLGARLEMRLSSAVGLWATFAQSWSGRATIDAGGDTSKISGSIKVRLVLADLALALNLTGDKTWHGLAPYVAVGAGIATPSAKVVDPGGYELGSNFTLVPTIGTRWYLARSLALRVEARDYYYRYTYPLSFFTLPYAGHANGSTLLPLSAPERKWAHNFTLWAGVTYGFTF